AKIIDSAVKTATNFIFRADYGDEAGDLEEGIAVLSKLIESIETDNHFSSLATSDNAADKELYEASVATLAQAFAKIDGLAGETYSITANDGLTVDLSENATQMLLAVDKLQDDLRELGVPVTTNLQV